MEDAVGEVEDAIVVGDDQDGAPLLARELALQSQLVAREVDRETFFHTRESGGTMISSAYKLCADIMQRRYPSQDWNVYPFHFSDGDNWSVDDTLNCIQILKTRVLPHANMFCYGQVESPYGSGQFVKDLREHLGKDERVVTSEIRDKDAIMDSIKAFLGKGR
jgi:uncharacterized sporulation protein YeaH/YhbH (DUF444 family)